MLNILLNFFYAENIRCRKEEISAPGEMQPGHF